MLANKKDDLSLCCISPFKYTMLLCSMSIFGGMHHIILTPIYGIVFPDYFFSNICVKIVISLSSPPFIDAQVYECVSSVIC